MPIDPSIPLQAKAPDNPNPLAMLLGVQQYKNQQQVGNRLQLDTAASQAAGRAIQQNTDANGNVNYPGVQAAMAKDPNATYGLQGATTTNLAQRGQNIANDTSQLKLTSDQYDHAVQNYGTLLHKNDLSYGDVVEAVSQAGKMYGLPNDVVKNSISSVPTDETQLKPFIQSRLASLQAPGAQLASMTPNPTLTTDGATNTYRDTNPITNPGIVGTAYQQKLSPAQAAGRLETVGPNGQPGSVPLSDTVPPNLLPPGMQGGATPAGRYPQQPQQPVRPGFVPSGLAPGVKQAADVAGQGAGQQLVADQSSNASSGSRLAMLQNASDALANATTGQGAEKLQALKGGLVTLGIATQSQADSVKNYDEANKYLTQYATAKAASFGGTTDAQLAAAMTGNGNTHISNLAAQDVVKVNMGLERMEQARMQQWQRSGLAPDQYATWKSQFGAAMDPRVFVADQMDPKKLGGMLQHMNQKERDTFSQQYRWAVQNGYVNGAQ